MNKSKGIIAGNLTRDPETRYTSSQLAVVTASVAVNRRKKKGDEWIEVTSFFDVTVFGRRGEAFAKFHRKGQPCYFEVELEQQRWDDKETGKKRSKIALIATDWDFVGSKGGGNGGGGGGRQQAADPLADPLADPGGGAGGYAADDTPF